MSQSSPPKGLRDRLVILVRANKPILDTLPDRLVGDLPPAVRMVASGILGVVPTNITEVIVAKINQMPEDRLQKLWDTISRMYGYCNIEPGGVENVESGPDISGTNGQGNDIGGNG